MFDWISFLSAMTCRDGAMAYLTHRNSYSAESFSSNFGTPASTRYRGVFRNTAQTLDQRFNQNVYEAPWPIFATCWHRGGNDPITSGKVAIGSMLEESSNRVCLIKANHSSFKLYRKKLRWMFQILKLVTDCIAWPRWM